MVRRVCAKANFYAYQNRNGLCGRCQFFELIQNTQVKRMTHSVPMADKSCRWKPESLQIKQFSNLLQ